MGHGPLGQPAAAKNKREIQSLDRYIDPQCGWLSGQYNCKVNISVYAYVEVLHSNH